jgi:DNA-binding IscR family transcriptional regulator
MAAVDDYILGNGALHDQFCITTEILAKLILQSPQPVGMAQLANYTGRAEKELARLCAGLARAKLLRPAADGSGNWMLACESGAVTLEDVFRCVIAAQPGRGKPAAKPDTVCRDADLLVMQATITINQSVFKHLRQFSLDRLKVSAAGIFSAGRPACRTSDYDDELASPHLSPDPI